jgi:hypothetical protein
MGATESKLEQPFRLRPGERGWPIGWPDSPEISQNRAVAVVHEHRELLSPDDYKLVMFVAGYYPWSYPSRALMAEHLCTSISGVAKRLRKLEKNGVIESFPARRRDLATQDFDNSRSLRRINLPGLHLPLKPHSVRRCAYCGGSIPQEKRADAKYCRDTHRKRHAEARALADG